MSEVLVFITAADEAEASKVADALLDAKLAACVNILPGLRSLYWWQGRRESAEEVLLLVKTTEEMLDELTQAVKSIHSYEVPEVVALPIVGGNPEYLEWIRGTVRQR
ncbi:MAG: divalent-cation tolerance protein CutA [Chloroflexi bacterium]|nr:divalent-cation tolerance protein CutA [Chloroflexota bacterium]